LILPAANRQDESKECPHRRRDVLLLEFQQRVGSNEVFELLPEIGKAVLTVAAAATASASAVAAAAFSPAATAAVAAAVAGDGQGSAAKERRARERRGRGGAEERRRRSERGGHGSSSEEEEAEERRRRRRRKISFHILSSFLLFTKISAHKSDLFSFVFVLCKRSDQYFIEISCFNSIVFCPSVKTLVKKNQQQNKT
jgi:cobalamin biosynthesis Mg chelatase CobN